MRAVLTFLLLAAVVWISAVPLGAGARAAEACVHAAAPDAPSAEAPAASDDETDRDTEDDDPKMGDLLRAGGGAVSPPGMPGLASERRPPWALEPDRVFRPPRA